MSSVFDLDVGKGTLLPEIGVTVEVSGENQVSAGVDGTGEPNDSGMLDGEPSDSGVKEVETFLGGKYHPRKSGKKQTKKSAKKSAKKPAKKSGKKITVKGNKKKGQSKWIMHVKKFQKSRNIGFGDAMKHPDCKKTYKSM